MGSHEGSWLVLLGHLSGQQTEASGGIISAPKGMKHRQGTERQPRPPSPSLSESLLGTRWRRDRRPQTEGKPHRANTLRQLGGNWEAGVGCDLLPAWGSLWCGLQITGRLGNWAQEGCMFGSLAQKG